MTWPVEMMQKGVWTNYRGAGWAQEWGPAECKQSPVGGCGKADSVTSTASVAGEPGFRAQLHPFPAGWPWTTHTHTPLCASDSPIINM